MGNMKKLIVLLTAATLLSACNTGGDGELTGVEGRAPAYDQTPYGMVLVEQGSYTMGPSDDDVPWALNAQSKTVSISSFWMDETEITNNEYRQFVHWVKDSLIRQALVDDQLEDYILRDREDNPIMMNKNGQESPRINWEEEIDYNDENGDVQAAIDRIGIYYTG